MKVSVIIGSGPSICYDACTEDTVHLLYISTIIIFLCFYCDLFTNSLIITTSETPDESNYKKNNLF